MLKENDGKQVQNGRCIWSDTWEIGDGDGDGDGGGGNERDGDDREANLAAKATALLKIYRILRNKRLPPNKRPLSFCNCKLHRI